MNSIFVYFQWSFVTPDLIDFFFVIAKEARKTKKSETKWTRLLNPLSYEHIDIFAKKRECSRLHDHSACESDARERRAGERDTSAAEHGKSCDRQAFLYVHVQKCAWLLDGCFFVVKLFSLLLLVHSIPLLLFNFGVLTNAQLLCKCCVHCIRWLQIEAARVQMKAMTEAQAHKEKVRISCTRLQRALCSKFNKNTY